MPLASTVPHQAVFFEAPALMLDTSALIDLAQGTDGAERFETLLSHYTLLVSTVAIYELSFGPSDAVSSGQSELEARLQRIAVETHADDQYAYSVSRNKGEISSGEIVIVNPSIAEWVSARNRLVRRITHDGGDYSKGKKKHSLDALIYSCARNRFAPLCTIDVGDFERMNLAANELPYDRSMPIFTLDQAMASLTSEVVYSPPSA